MTKGAAWKNRAVWVAALSLVILACGPEGGATGSGSGSGSGAGGADGGPSLHTLKVTLSGNGSVTSTPAGINCGTTCTASFPAGTAVTLIPKAGSGSNLTSWTGACSGTNACIVVLNVDTSVGATFVAGAPPPPPPPPPPLPPPPPPPPPPPSDECADLVPASLPPPVVTQVTTGDPNGQNCLSGVGDDGDGTFLLGYHADGFGPGVRKHVFFQIQNGAAARVGGTVLGGEDTGHLVFSQPSGFSVFSVFGDFDNSVLESWSHDGVFQSRTEIAPADPQVSGPHPPSSAVGIDPSGGTAAVKTVFTDGKFVTTYQRFDKNGVPGTGEVRIDNGELHVGAVGIALSGHALILSATGNGNWEGRWVARDGSPISKPFTLQGTGAAKFQFLLDGSLALGFVQSFNDPPSSFQHRIEDGAEVAGPLPAWLSPRSGNLLFAVRQGKAYATWGGGGRCGPDVEVLTNSGKSCGCIKVSELSRSASVGRDGSLIVPHQNVAQCAYDLYPKLLR